MCAWIFGCFGLGASGCNTCWLRLVLVAFAGFCVLLDLCLVALVVGVIDECWTSCLWLLCSMCCCRLLGGGECGFSYVGLTELLVGWWLSWLRVCYGLVVGCGCLLWVVVWVGCLVVGCSSRVLLAVHDVLPARTFCLWLVEVFGVVCV